MRFACLILVFSIFPGFASAQVVINEIAWMGTDEGGANCEWIELRNMGSEIVDLSNWTLTIENINATPRVLLLSARGENSTGEVDRFSGIAGNGYYLLARNSSNSGVACDDDFLGVNADWFNSFGSGISNTRATLTLTGPSGEEDKVVGNTDWDKPGGLGGKNTAPKQTAQRSGNTWITAAPTARGPNHIAPFEELPEEKEEIGAPVVTIGGTAPLTPIPHPIPKLYVDAGPARIVIAGADTTFSAVVYNSVGERKRSADIVWTFGDGGQKKGDEVQYAYRKPGEYTATVRAREDGVSVVTLVPVRVVGSGVSVTSVSEEGVILTNTADKFADLSGWKIGSGRKAKKLPEDTVIAPGASVLFSFDALHLPPSNDIALQFPNGHVAYQKPFLEDTELQPVSAPKTLAVVPTAYEEEAVNAPTAQDDLAVVGAPYTKEESTVILKEEHNFFGGMGTLLASAFSSVAGIFLR